MKIEMILSEFVEDKNGGHFEHVNRTIETKAEGRHSMLCNICGMDGYPECREWCPNGGDEES